MAWLILIVLSCFVYSSVWSALRTEIAIYPPADQEPRHVCKVSLKDNRQLLTRSLEEDSPLIYFVTPTYSRPEQIAELTRLGQTLLHVPNLHWIIAEDAKTCSPVVSEILERFGIPYTHLTSPMPEMYKVLRYKPRGVSNRRAGLWWIRQQGPRDGGAVVYFADDDNTYDLRLFQELRKTKRVSMFPVGFIGSQGFSAPIVRDGKVVGFSDVWFAHRRFPVDMAGFAVNTEFIENRAKPQHSLMPYKAGHEETLFLEALNLTMEEIEPLAEDCSKVLVWHTKTVRVEKTELKPTKHTNTNLVKLITDLVNKGMLLIQDHGFDISTCFKKTCKTGSH